MARIQRKAIRFNNPVFSKTKAKIRPPIIIQGMFPVHGAKATFPFAKPVTTYSTGKAKATPVCDKESVAKEIIAIKVNTKNKRICDVKASLVGIRNKHNGIPTVKRILISSFLVRPRATIVFPDI